ncbi:MULTISPECIES: ABC transporter ATP-binding protein [unclassified Oceanispirochaeta]|uniref:ABC transporter ATP-binding protein n=1 Tax=unclassified Oceanispirochaeta TaxID=2635722 RepID=UPI000E096F3F|nr:MULTISPECIES: ABC transporter ATP-binding protein [unclassified Oceanispirochaeta]MBF9014411.1 ABC transporter ATP-binding protein [Oceanispirochaeta sp. M2]NPD71297.1 ABC transporter ATP-binding protein [Oceanispirochaeta sp. M1]RDG33678.1 ABC transporter ATP-binding protein [Oceanispirochaeta sp. M1]
MIKLNNISRTYPMGSVEVHALKGVNLHVLQGDFVAVVGPSGAGKTTIMNIIGLIDDPSSGELCIGGESVAGLNDRQKTRLRRESLGFIFQSFNLLPVLSVEENIELPLMLGAKPPARVERRDRVSELVAQVGLKEWRHHKPSELSGGQRQRVAIARALITRPKIVIADEPTANLDSGTSDDILGLMKEINTVYRTTFIFSTHDPVIRNMANHVVYLKDGLIQNEERYTGK